METAAKPNMVLTPGKQHGLGGDAFYSCNIRQSVAQQRGNYSLS